MGSWGIKLYQNDMALDVKGEFEEQFNKGKAVPIITEQLIEEYKNIKGNPNEEPIFWFALADTQWDFGVLLPEVKEQALYWISEEPWKHVFADLQGKLISPQPSVKKQTRKKLYQCQWNIGDVFAYRLESDLAKEKGFLGQYFLVQKVDEGIWYPGHIIPIVYIKMTKDTTLPCDIVGYNELEYVQISFTKYEQRFWPIDMCRPQEDIAEKSKINYEVDEYGYLPVYRAELLNTSPKSIPSKLIYIGNFANAICPQKEFIPHAKINITPVSWDEFETKMISRYCGHNLREFSIYGNNKN